MRHLVAPQVTLNYSLSTWRVRGNYDSEILDVHDFLPDFALTVSNFAKALGVSRQTVNE